MEKGKRITMTFRVTKATHDAVVERAHKNGRSVAAEMELMLERSFWEDEVYGAAFVTWSDLSTLKRTRGERP